MWPSLKGRERSLDWRKTGQGHGHRIDADRFYAGVAGGRFRAGGAGSQPRNREDISRDGNNTNDVVEGVLPTFVEWRGDQDVMRPCNSAFPSVRG